MATWHPCGLIFTAGLKSKRQSLLQRQRLNTSCLNRRSENGDAAAQQWRRRWIRWPGRRLPAFEELEGSEVNGVEGDSEAVESCWAFGFPNTVSVRHQLDDQCVCGSYRKPSAICCLHFPLCHWHLLFWLHGRIPFLSLHFHTVTGVSFLGCPRNLWSLS